MITALWLHTGSINRVPGFLHALQDLSHPVVVVDCSSSAGVTVASQLLQGQMAGALPGASHSLSHSQSSLDGSHDTLLVSALTHGTLVLDNIHKVSFVAASPMLLPCPQPHHHSIAFQNYSGCLSQHMTSNSRDVAINIIVTNSCVLQAPYKSRHMLLPSPQPHHQGKAHFGLFVPLSDIRHA
jgi:hypothetical protein